MFVLNLKTRSSKDLVLKFKSTVKPGFLNISFSEQIIVEENFELNNCDGNVVTEQIDLLGNNKN